MGRLPGKKFTQQTLYPHLPFPRCGKIKNGGHEAYLKDTQPETNTQKMTMSTREEPQRPQKYWRDDEELRWTVKEWATRIGVKEPPIRFQIMPEKWGTITPSGWLTLDPTLLKIPRHLGEMVIVHELVHELAPNHSRLFKHFMDAYLPGWKEIEQELQTYVNKI